MATHSFLTIFYLSVLSFYCVWVLLSEFLRSYLSSNYFLLRCMVRRVTKIATFGYKKFIDHSPFIRSSILMPAGIAL